MRDFGISSDGESQGRRGVWSEDCVIFVRIVIGIYNKIHFVIDSYDTIHFLIGSYGTSKLAVLGMAEALHTELKLAMATPRVRVVALCPGLVRTSLLEST